MPAPSARAGSLTGLFALLAIASFFEGFDTMLASLVLPNLGRFGMTVAPAAVGSAAAALGSTGDAVTILGLAAVLALPALARWLPETRGTRLDAAG